MERTVCVTGESRREVAPDRCELRLTLRGLCETYGEAVEESMRQTELLKRAAVSCGFSGEDLKTGRFSCFQEEESVRDPETGEYKTVPKGFRFEHGLKLLFPRSDETLQNLLDAFSSCGADVQFSLAFGLIREDALREELRREAAKSAERAAQELALALNVKLGRVTRVTHGVRVPQASEECADGMRLFGKRAASFSLTPDLITLSDSVTVEWEIL